MSKRKKHANEKITDPLPPTDDEQDLKIKEVIAKGTKEGWWIVTATQPYERTEYIGPVDKGTAIDIIDYEMFSYGCTKTMHNLTSLPMSGDITPSRQSISAYIFFSRNADIPSYGPFSDIMNACYAVSEKQKIALGQGTPSDEIKDNINQSDLIEVHFSPRRLLYK